MKYLFLIFCAAALIASCSGPVEAPDNPGDEQQVDKKTGNEKEEPIKKAGMEKLKDLFTSGMGLKCTYVITEEGATTSTTSWVTHGKARVEATIMYGETTEEVLVITKEEGVYMQNNQFTEVDCDWIFIESDDEAEVHTLDFDEELSLEEAISAQEADLDVEMSCSPAVVQESMFTPDGSTCTMEELMEAMLGDMDFDY